MAVRADGVHSELADFLSEVKCPRCSMSFKVAPVWDFVLGKGWSSCGSCGQIYALKSGAKLEGFAVKEDDLDTVADDFETANAHQYIWDAAKLERNRSAAVDFFISLAFTAFFDGLERSYPLLQQDDFKTAWQYLSQAGALAVDNLDTRLIADAFEKVEKHKPPDRS
jgi:transcription elongation factor Elf1